MKKGIWVGNSFVEFNGKKNWKLTDEIATRNRSMDFYTLGRMMPNPDPVLKKLGKDITVYNELYTEPHVGACITSRKAGVTSLCWEIGRGQEKTPEIETIEKRLKKLKLQKIIKEILNAPLYGYKPLEVTWEQYENMWLPVKVAGKPPEWFCFDSENNLRFKSRESSWDGELLPEKKFLCPQHEASDDNPYGKPVLSNVFWSVTFKKGGWEFWIVFTEKYGMPIFLGKHPPGATKTEKDELAAALENAVRDAVIVISENSNLELIESPFKASSTGTYKELIKSCNDEISKAILGQTLTTEIGNTGARAASETHFKVRQDIVDSDKNLVMETINELITWIYELNFPGKDIPEFEMWEPEDVDLTLAQRDEILSRTGVKYRKIYFQKNYNLDEEDFDIAELQQQNTFPPAQFAEAALDSNPLDELEKAVSDKELQQIAEDLLKPVIELVKSGNSYEDVLEALSEQYPLMNTGAMQNLFGKAMFISEGLGRFSSITK